MLRMLELRKVSLGCCKNVTGAPLFPKAILLGWSCGRMKINYQGARLTTRVTDVMCGTIQRKTGDIS